MIVWDGSEDARRRQQFAEFVEERRRHREEYQSGERIPEREIALPVPQFLREEVGRARDQNAANSRVSANSGDNAAMDEIREFAETRRRCREAAAQTVGNDFVGKGASSSLVNPPCGTIGDEEYNGGVLDVAAILERGPTVLEKRMILQLNRSMETEPKPGIRVLGFEAAATKNGVEVQYVRVPVCKGADDKVTTETLRRLAKLMQYVGTLLNCGSHALGRFLARADATVAQEAVSAANLSGPTRLSLEQSEQFINLAGVSFHRYALISKFFRSVSSFRIAPVGQIRAQNKFLCVDATYRNNVVLASRGGKTVKSMVVNIDLFLLAARDLDVNSDRKSRNKIVFRVDVGKKVCNFMLMWDGGGSSEKFVLRLLNVAHPCSPVHCSLFTSGEAMKPDGDKPSSSYENAVEMLRFVDGRWDLHEHTVVELNGRHVLVPTRACPVVWTSIQVANTADRLVFFSDRQAQGLELPEDKLIARRALVPGCAVLVFFNGLCIGVRAGGLTFAFREPVVADFGAPEVVMSSVEVYNSADFQAMAMVVGQPGQSPFVCPFCCTSPKTFKLTAADPQRHRTCLRTLESQLRALRKFRALTTKKKSPVDGVSQEPLWYYTYLRLIPPYLHLMLGLVNDCVRITRSELKVLDEIDPALDAIRDAMLNQIQDFECDLALALIETRLLLGDGHALVVEHIGGADVDPGTKIESVTLENWSLLNDAMLILGESKANSAEALPPGDARESLESEIDELTAGSFLLSSSIDNLGRLRAELANHDLVHNADGKPEGVLTTLFKEAMWFFQISISRYWLVRDSVFFSSRCSSSLNIFYQGILVGPDVRKYLLHYRELLMRLKVTFVGLHGDAVWTTFFTRHCSVLEHLVVVSHHTRSVEMLSEEQLTELRSACAGFAVSFRLAYDRILTVKGHVVEMHVMEYAESLGTCGALGEDGLEALHPMYTAARVLCRTMRNANARTMATEERVQLKKKSRTQFSS